MPVAIRGLAPVLLASAVVCGACTTKADHSPSVPSQSASQTPSGVSSSSKPSASVSAPVLPTACSQLLPLSALQRIIGFGLLGEVTYLRAAPVPQSGRTGRVTCGYGTPVAQPTGTASPGTLTPTGPPLVQASYITYVNARTANARVQTTVEADAAGAVVTEATVAGKPANILIGVHTTELVMSDGARTIVVVVSPQILAPDKAPDALKAIAEIMLRFDRPVSASPSGPVQSTHSS